MAWVWQWGFALESMPAQHDTQMLAGHGCGNGHTHTNVSWARGAAVGLGVRQDVDGFQFNAPRGTLHGTLCRTSHREESDSSPILQTRGKSRMKHLQGAPKPET